MPSDELKQEILDVLLPDRDSYGNRAAKMWQVADGFTIEYGQMYDSPTLGFKELLKISEIFGTTAIDVDDYSISGCESCDHGSDYGHTIQIKNPTKNLDAALESCGVWLKT